MSVAQTLADNYARLGDLEMPWPVWAIYDDCLVIYCLTSVTASKIEETCKDTFIDSALSDTGRVGAVLVGYGSEPIERIAERLWRQGVNLGEERDMRTFDLHTAEAYAEWLEDHRHLWHKPVANSMEVEDGQHRVLRVVRPE